MTLNLDEIEQRAQAAAAYARNGTDDCPSWLTAKQAADVAALVAEVKRLTAQVDDLTVAYNASMGILGKSLLGDDFQMPPFKPGGE